MRLYRKGLVLGIIVLFVGTGVISSSVGTLDGKFTFLNLNSGSYIQGLIDNASDGDIINIPSGIYYENIIINKSISLIGEDKNTTIIHSGSIEDVVKITSDWVNISGFTMRNGRGGIDALDSDYITITNNILTNNYYGIFLGASSYNTITGNIITSNTGNGLHIASSYHNTITGNTITSNDDGIFFHLSHYNTIINSLISDNKRGIYLGGSKSNRIEGNTISDNRYCILLRFLTIWHGHQPSSNNTIMKNNFLGYRQHTLCGGGWSNKWNENYWNRPRMFPKLIFGVVLLGFYGVGSIPIILPWFNIDWHPAKEPHDIEM
jgi:parallel beta-helix repeat protein